MQRARLMEDLRNDIDVSVQPSGKREEPGRSTGCATGSPDRGIAASRSWRSCSSNFMNDTVSGKMQIPRRRRNFCSSRSRETEQRLREAEERLAAFKKRNVGTMPGAEGDYFTRLQNEMDAARKARTALVGGRFAARRAGQQLKDGALLAASSGRCAVAFEPRIGSPETR